MELVKVKNSYQEDDILFFELEKFFFHPQGGGQPNDKLYDKNGVPVLIRKQPEGLFLGVNPNILENGHVRIKIDKEFNHFCSRLHSAGHLLALVVERDFNKKPIKAHHFPNEAYVKFEGILDKEQIAALPSIVNKEIELDYQVTIDKDEQGRRVHFGELGFYHCRGTHVVRLGEIGKIIIGTSSAKKGATTIKYDIV